MDPGGEREEGDRQHQRPHQQPAGIVAARDLPEGDEGGGGEEERPDQLPGDRGRADREGDSLPHAAGRRGHVAAPLEGVAEPGERVAPEVEAVDGEALVGVGRLQELADQAAPRVRWAPDAEAEGQDQQDQRAEARGERAEHAHRIPVPVVHRVGRATEEVALDPHDRDDGGQEAELELHQQRDHRPHRGRLGPAAGEQVDGPHRGQRPDRVDLAPDRRVEDRAGVEEVDGGRHQADPLAAPRPEPSVPETPREGEEEPRDARVGEDPGHLHQATGDQDARDRLQQLADGAEQPEHVHVAGRVVPEVVGRVEVARAAAGEALGPRVEVADVDAEAALRHVDAADEGAQQHAQHDEDDDQRRGVEGQAAFDWPRAPLPDGVAGHRWRRLVIGAGVGRAARWAGVYIRLPDGPGPGSVALGYGP